MKNELVWFSKNISFILWGTLLINLFFAGCATQKLCVPDPSNSCEKAIFEWQTIIDQVGEANFPNYYGLYKAVVWEGEFDNAWVTKGININITRRMLEKLNPVRRICVAAHELAHLKMGHYYSRMGIIIVNDESILPTYGKGHSTNDNELSIDVPEGFGINQEVEADRLALKFIKRLGLNKNHYLDLLFLLKGENKDPDSLISKRIDAMKQIQ
jgi:hypothetical protein